MPRPVIVVVLIGALLLAGCKSTSTPSYIGSTADDPCTRWCEDHPVVTNTAATVGVVLLVALLGAAYLYLDSLDGELDFDFTDDEAEDALSQPIPQFA